jgi:CheY-like chemotaxis protein
MQTRIPRPKRQLSWVVDDEKAVLRITLRMLDVLGHVAVSAVSGKEGLQLIASGVT